MLLALRGASARLPSARLPTARLPRALALAAAFSVLLLSGLIPFVWDIPLLAKVQFPWRLLCVIEVATIGAFALAASSVPSRTMRRTMLVMAVLSGPAVALIGYECVANALQATAWARDKLPVDLAGTPDATEYLPAGIPYDVARSYSRIETPLSPPARTVSCMPVATRCERMADGIIMVDAPAPVTVMVQTFYFPGWQARTVDGAAIPAYPATAFRILGFDMPAGITRFRTERVQTAPERIGSLCSWAALVIVVGWLAAARWRIFGARQDV